MQKLYEVVSSVPRLIQEQRAWHLWITFLLFDYSLITWKNQDMQRYVILLSLVCRSESISTVSREYALSLLSLPYQGSPVLDSFFCSSCHEVVILLPYKISLLRREKVCFLKVKSK